MDKKAFIPVEVKIFTFDGQTDVITTSITETEIDGWGEEFITSNDIIGGNGF